MDSKTVITKETKNRIHVDYEGKLSTKERLLKKLKASNTWVKACVNIFKFILMLGVSYVILFPFFSKVAGSFMSPTDVADATVSLIPRAFTLDQYKYIIQDNGYFVHMNAEGAQLGAFFNTLLLSVICALIQTMVACLVGYGLAKFKFKGNNLVMVVVVITMIIPHSALELSMLRHFTSFDLGHVMATETTGILSTLTGGKIELTNTYWPFVVLSLGGIAFKNGLYIYLLRQFFKGVPDELEESAYVDGSGTFRTFVQIILPLSVPMMITVFLFSFSWQWTDQFYSGIFFMGATRPWVMPDITVPPTSLQILYGNHPVWTLYQNILQSTAGILIIAPLVVMYLFCQKYLVQGIERSGLVG